MVGKIMRWCRDDLGLVLDWAEDEIQRIVPTATPRDWEMYQLAPSTLDRDFTVIEETPEKALESIQAIRMETASRLLGLVTRVQREQMHARATVLEEHPPRFVVGLWRVKLYVRGATRMEITNLIQLESSGLAKVSEEAHRSIYNHLVHGRSCQVLPFPDEVAQALREAVPRIPDWMRKPPPPITGPVFPELAPVTPVIEPVKAPSFDPHRVIGAHVSNRFDTELDRRDWVGPLGSDKKP